MKSIQPYSDSSTISEYEGQHEIAILLVCFRRHCQINWNDVIHSIDYAGWNKVWNSRVEAQIRPPICVYQVLAEPAVFQNGSR